MGILKPVEVSSESTEHSFGRRESRQTPSQAQAGFRVRILPSLVVEWKLEAVGMLAWGPGLREGRQPLRGCLSRRSRALGALGAGMPFLPKTWRGGSEGERRQDPADQQSFLGGSGRHHHGPCVQCFLLVPMPRHPPSALPPGGEGGRLVSI